MKRKNCCWINRLTFKNYSILFGALEFMFTFLYVQKFAMFSVDGRRAWALAGLIVICAGSSLFLTWWFRQSWIGLMTGTIFPLLLFETLSMWSYSSVIRITILIAGVSAGAAALCLIMKKDRRGKRFRVRNRHFRMKCLRMLGLMYCLTLLETCIYGRWLIYSHYVVSQSDISYSESDTYNDTEDYENSLDANIETVMKIDPEGGWSDLSVDEKMEVLETIARIECRYLGMRDSAPSLEIAYLEESLLGQYNYEEDVITLSYNYIVDSGSSGYSVVQVLCHELYHRYQRYQVNLLEVLKEDADTEKYADLLLLYNAGIYEEEIADYVSPTDDSELSYYLYSTQSMELDAQKYGNASVADYYSEIQSYLDSD